MDILIAVGVIVLLVILAIIIYRFIRATVRVVPQEERLVIYRVGRFHRIAGPGLVWVLPRVEEARPINVRDRPHEITISQIFAFGVSNELTLNLWCSFDLAKAAGDDKEKLSQLVQLSEPERRRQLEVKIREALVHQLSDLQRRRPLPKTATSFDGVIALAAGSDRYNELLEGITRELAQSLRSIGVVLNTSQPITLIRRGIPDAIIAALQRKYGREIDSEWLTKYAGLLRKDFPDIPGTVLAQVLSAIEGVDAGKLQRLFLEGEGKGEVEAEVEYEMSGDGSSAPNVIAKPKVKAAARPQAASAKVDKESPRLTRDDLSVLKRVPRDSHDHRKTA